MTWIDSMDGIGHIDGAGSIASIYSGDIIDNLDWPR